MTTPPVGKDSGTEKSCPSPYYTRWWLGHGAWKVDLNIKHTWQTLALQTSWSGNIWHLPVMSVKSNSASPCSWCYVTSTSTVMWCNRWRHASSALFLSAWRLTSWLRLVKQLTSALRLVAYRWKSADFSQSKQSQNWVPFHSQNKVKSCVEQQSL